METQIGERKRPRNENRSKNSETEPTNSSRTRLRMRHRGRPRNSRSGSAGTTSSLAEYLTPELASKFCLSPSSDNSENQEPVSSVEESPFRSPLHKSRRGLQSTTPRRGRRSPHNVGTNSSGNRGAHARRGQKPQTSLEDELESERRVRKCLWADEVDEAFCEGDDVCDEPMVVRELPKTPTKDQLARRQKDIDYGKATDGYKNYVEKVSKNQRCSDFPETPNKHEKVPRRVWDGKVRMWRKTLHNWDQPTKGVPSPSNSRPTGISESLSEREAMSPISSVTSTPSDKGYVTTPDSKANHSFFDMGQGDSPCLAEMDTFPPLPSSPDRKPWWKQMEQEEEANRKERLDEFKEATLTEEDHLDQSVKNLTIGSEDRLQSEHDAQGADEDAETQEEGQVQS